MEFSMVTPQSHLDGHPVWARAALDSHQADPFCCTTEWQLSFHEAFSPERRLLVDVAPDSVVAFAENAVSPEEVYLVPLEEMWFFANPLLGHSSLERFPDVLAFFERTYSPYFPKIVLGGVRPGFPQAETLLRYFSRRFDFYLFRAGLQCAASLEGGVDGYLSRRSANHRKKLRRQQRRAQETGVRFERVVPQTEEEAGAAFARMIAVEETSWKGIGRCGMNESPVDAFYDSMLRRLSRRRAGRVIFARHEDKDIGYIFGGLAGSIYRGQQFSFDEEWKRYSIGNLMQLEKITWLCENGVTRYDMGPLTGPGMEYKAHWAEEKIEIQTWVMERR